MHWITLLVLAAAPRVGVVGRPEPVAVLTETVGRGIVEASVANTRAGRSRPASAPSLSTIAGGRIELLAVKEGDKVRKGQLLMRLWNDDLRAEQAYARAQLGTLAAPHYRSLHAGRPGAA